MSSTLRIAYAYDEFVLKTNNYFNALTISFIVFSITTNGVNAFSYRVSASVSQNDKKGFFLLHEILTLIEIWVMDKKCIFQNELGKRPFTRNVSIIGDRSQKNTFF